MPSDDTTHFCEDFARSSRARASTDPACAPAACASSSLAGDASDLVRRSAASGGTDAPASLTIAQLVKIYECTTPTGSRSAARARPSRRSCRRPPRAPGRSSLPSSVAASRPITPGSCVSDAPPRPTRRDPGRERGHQPAAEQRRDDLHLLGGLLPLPGVPLAEVHQLRLQPGVLRPAVHRRRGPERVRLQRDRRAGCSRRSARRSRPRRGRDRALKASPSTQLRILASSAPCSTWSASTPTPLTTSPARRPARRAASTWRVLRRQGCRRPRLDLQQHHSQEHHQELRVPLHVAAFHLRTRELTRCNQPIHAHC